MRGKNSHVPSETYMISGKRERLAFQSLYEIFSILNWKSINQSPVFLLLSEHLLCCLNQNVEGLSQVFLVCLLICRDNANSIHTVNDATG